MSARDDFRHSLLFFSRERYCQRGPVVVVLVVVPEVAAAVHVAAAAALVAAAVAAAAGESLRCCAPDLLEMAALAQLLLPWTAFGSAILSSTLAEQVNVV